MFCELYLVAHRHSSWWKWRAVGADGLVTECIGEFRVYIECVAAARARGYEPRAQWTAPVAQLT